MGLVSPEAPPPEDGTAPPDDGTPLLDQQAGMGMPAPGQDPGQGPQQDPQGAPPPQAPAPEMAAPAGAPAPGMDPAMAGDPMAAQGDPAATGLMVDDPLAVSKDEGQYAVNPPAMIALLNKLLAAKYSLWVLYQHYGTTMLARCRDGLHEHFQTHAGEEQQLAYDLGKKIVALGGQALPKVSGLKPAFDFQTMLLQLLEAEQKSIKLWRELDLAAGENLGLKTAAGDCARLDTAHADDLRRYLRSPE
jgi:bacterioferritin (cytochrome b1)